MTWCDGDACEHAVRCGPNYKKNGKKAPSAPALYECYGVDFFWSTERVDHAIERFKIRAPPAPSATMTSAAVESTAGRTPATSGDAAPASNQPVTATAPVETNGEDGSESAVPGAAAAAATTDGALSTPVRLAQDLAAQKVAESQSSDSHASEPGTERSATTISIPPLLVVNAQLPSAGPSMFKKKGPAKEYGVLLYYRPTAQTLAMCASPETATPALKLFSRFCAFRGKDGALPPKRFKAIGVVDNLEEVSLPSLVTTYNGKPVRLTKPGRKYHGECVTADGKKTEYMELEMHLHEFSMMARKGLTSSVLPNLPKIVLHVAFVIEADADANEEMPEGILGCVKLNFLDTAKAFELK